MSPKSALHSTSLKTTAEELLELRGMINVHERVVFSRHISKYWVAATESTPWLELLEPVDLVIRATRRDGVENIDDS